MRFAHVLTPSSHSSAPLLVVLETAADGVERGRAVGDMFPGAPRTLDALVAGGGAMLDRVRDALDGPGPTLEVSGMPRASALLHPPVVLAIGLNYAAHSGELGLRADTAPTVFTLWPNSLTGHGQTTVWPRTLSESVDYEAELGVIIGAPGRDVAPEDALDHVWGYTVVNDITARDIQFAEAQWSRCKSFDGFTPVGPCVVTADEIADPQDLHIWTQLDGQIVQDASTSQMIRSVATLISHLSRAITLQPGTLISTGSPGGAGYSRDPQIFLRDRSQVTVAIDGIGELTTRCRIEG